MVLFMVQASTFGLFTGARLMASERAFERDDRTVRRVMIPVRGAAVNLMASETQPTCMVGATVNGTPGYSLHAAPKRVVGVQPTPGFAAPRCSYTGDARAAFSRASAGPE